MSHCPSCGADVAADQRFCVSCGVAQTGSPCPGCGAETTPGMRFCGQCGTQLEQLTQALHAPAAEAPAATERRLVSVLFADLVGFTALSEDEDPEAVREFLTAYFERASDVIGRYGGTVEKFIGDAVMAVWGTPTAHEDDAERATRAALELVGLIRDLGADTEIRSAVTTGEAAVTVGATGQGLVAGDLVNTSSRLQSAATPGTVLVDETTMVAAGRAIAFEARGEISLKGKAEPVKAWTAMRVVAERGGSGRRDVLEPPFVGREEELRLLKDSLHATSREGKPRLITLVGQAGLGKSRLAWELKKYIDGLMESVYWHEGRSPAYGEDVVYWALGEMVRERIRVLDSEGADATRARLRSSVEEFVSDEEERRWIEPRLAALLGIADAPSGDREELYAAWRTFFERISEQGTVALIFEDLQWADDGLFDFIEHLLEWARSSAIVVVGLARPDLLERRPSWGSGHRASTIMHLEPLSDEAMGDLLRGTVPGLPDTTLDQVVARAEGIPLYAVETVRMLLDESRLILSGERYRLVDGTATVAVPASLQALVTARLDALGLDEKGLVQDAAVLGKTFSYEAVAAVSGRSGEALDDMLRQLVRKEILAIEIGRTSPERGQYGFVQGLLREVAYSTLSRRDRRDRHLAAANYFESLEDEELAGMLARHFLDAYRSAPEGPEGEAAASQARVALRAAAERSISLHANAAAVTFIEEALEVTREPEQRAELWVMAAEPAWAHGETESAQENIRSAIDWYTTNGRLAEADDAIVRMATLLIHTRLLGEIRGLLETSVARLDDASAGPMAPRLLNELARAYLFEGRHDDAFEPVERGLAIAERLALEPEIAELFITKSWAVDLLGRHQEALLLSEGGLRLAERLDLVSTELRARMNLANGYDTTDPRLGFEVATKGVELAERVGQAGWSAALAGNEGMAALLLGRWEVPIARAAELDRPHISGYSRLSVMGPAIVAAAFRGETEGTWQERIADLTIDDVAPDVVESFISTISAMAAYAAGDLEDVDRFAHAGMKGTTHQLESTLAASFAARAMTWLGERDRLEGIVDQLETVASVGEVAATSLKQARGAMAAMEGRFDEAESTYRETLATWRRLGLVPDIATAEMEMLKLLGDRLMDRDDLAAEAHHIATGIGAVTLLARLGGMAPVEHEMEVAR